MIDFQEHKKRIELYKESLQKRFHDKVWTLKGPHLEEQLAKEENQFKKMVMLMTPSADATTLAIDFVVYIGIHHYLLFTDYRLYGTPQSRYTAEELYQLLMGIEPFAAEAVLRKLNCSQKEFEPLITAWRSCDQPSFISNLKSLSCDLSGLAALCERIRRIQLGIEVRMGDLDTYMDYKRGEPCEEEEANDMLIRLEKRVAGIYKPPFDQEVLVYQFIQEENLYPFERELLQSLINEPEITKRISKKKPDSRSDEKNVDAIATDPTITKDSSGLLCPTDEEFARSCCVANRNEYFFPSSVLGPSTGLKMTTIQELYFFLVDNGKLDKSDEALLLFAFRLTGKNPRNIDVNHKLIWHGDPADCHFAYFLGKMFSRGKHALDSKYWKKGALFFEYDDGSIDKDDERERLQQFTHKTERSIHDTFADNLRQKILDLTSATPPIL